MPSPPPTLLEGTPYRIIGRVGQGSMGLVVEAEHVALARRCCIKILTAPALDESTVQERFRVEAQTLAQLDHPNIVRVTDYGHTAEGRPYLVMERLVGHPLDKLLERGRSMDLELALDRFLELLAGLEAAHRIGVVHRDIKPGNLFVCDPPPDASEPAAPFLKILDFGISKLMPRAGYRGRTLVPAPATEEGIALGTPRYFAPEQARGAKVDPRSDLYSATAVLYRMVAGVSPFEHRKSLPELAKAHLDERPKRLSELCERPVPAWLDEIALRGLAKKPEDRFPNARAFASEIRRHRSPPDRRRIRRRRERAAATEILPDAPTQKLPRRGPTGTEPLSPELVAMARRPRPSATGEPTIYEPPLERTAPSPPLWPKPRPADHPPQGATPPAAGRSVANRAARPPKTHRSPAAAKPIRPAGPSPSTWVAILGLGLMLALAALAWWR